MPRIFQELELLYPHPKTELNYCTDFELLVAVMLSARTTNRAVNQVTAKLFPVANTPDGILDLGLAALKQHISSIGLYNNKSQNLLKLSRMLVDTYQSQVPKNLKDLMDLPGIGRKTAQVFLNNQTGASYISVDTHVLRVANRLGLSRGRTPLKVEQDLLHRVPSQHIHQLSKRLVLHGRYVCKSQNPKCQQCPLKKWCLFYNNVISIPKL